MPPNSVPHHALAIVGSGFAGIGAAIRLRDLHGGSVVLYERAEEIGGVWRDNTYPGAACDVQSLLYSFSFTRGDQWRHHFARQEEIRAYLHRTLADYGLDDAVRRNCEVRSLRWHAASGRWLITTSAGTATADHVVLATGALSDPVIPALPGIDDFRGARFHSSRWDHDLDLTGKRVAVVGTGASAIQFVPAIQPVVGKLTVFQRSAPWVMPRHDGPLSAAQRTVMERSGLAKSLMRLSIWIRREFKLVAFRHPRLMKIGEKEARAHLDSQIADPALRAKLTPGYQMGCKRVLLSDEYYPAVAQPNVEVETSGIDHVTADGIVDANGVRHPVDVLVFGTGFATAQLPLTDRTIGEAGQTLAERWEQSPTAYLGTMVAGFPNLYLMHGPNIGLGHSSVIMMFESQLEYVARAMRHAMRGGGVIAPTPDAQRRFAAHVDQLSAGTVWTTGSCTSWYLDATGRNSNIWPASTATFRRLCRRFKPADHVVSARADHTDFVSAKPIGVSE